MKDYRAFSALASALSGYRNGEGMLINSIHFTFDEKDAVIVENVLRELRDASRKEPGVLQYDVGRSTENPNVFAFWEVYRDKDALDAHFASEHFQRLFVDTVKPLVQQRDVERVVPI
ncbi:MAG: antibiotic biosynthesis monooxygenase [Candidatus Eremiobacteraeota bacterium]|nr:antibiotic biosynthesis monooxygenase [Candidatus Eremiobacteraeota bacterium]